jgi:uncharacterized protein (DUF4415 family)
MNVKRMSKPSPGTNRPRRGRADLNRLRQMSEHEIARTAPPELADLPAGFWAGARVVHPVSKQPVSLRLDSDVLAWFKMQGPRYQSRMNAVLRSYMAAMRGRKKQPGPA